MYAWDGTEAPLKRMSEHSLCFLMRRERINFRHVGRRPQEIRPADFYDTTPRSNGDMVLFPCYRSGKECRHRSTGGDGCSCRGLSGAVTLSRPLVTVDPRSDQQPLCLRLLVFTFTLYFSFRPRRGTR